MGSYPFKNPVAVNSCCSISSGVPTKIRVDFSLFTYRPKMFENNSNTLLMIPKEIASTMEKIIKLSANI